ncbi:MAG: hypothetical protein M3R17_01215 [Bacteroidota bacterium]|nr:hypothetical protein [Bacteroidota bacterium]
MGDFNGQVKVRKKADERCFFEMRNCSVRKAAVKERQQSSSSKGAAAKERQSRSKTVKKYNSKEVSFLALRFFTFSLPLFPAAKISAKISPEEK